MEALQKMIASRRLFVAFLGLLFAVFCPAIRLSAQENPEPQLPKASLNVPEAKKIQDLFLKYSALLKLEDVDNKDRMKQAAALTEFTNEVTKFEKEKKVGSLLADDAAWLNLFTMSYSDRIKTGKEKSPAGKGTIKEEFEEVNIDGEYVRCEYAYSLPNAYTSDKAWPVLLCLHDKGCPTAKDYLKNMWDDDKESKDIRENFIIVAPTLHKITPDGPSKREKGKKLAVKHVGWFDKVHMHQITVPIREMRKRFNCDPARLYVEGVGLGGQTALKFTEYYGLPWIAGVVLRNAQPKDLALIGGLRDKPVLFLYREGGIVDSGEPKKFWDDLKSVATKEAITTFSYVTKPALEKPTPKQMAMQPTEPVKEGNKDVWDFLQSKVLAPYPKQFRLVSNSPLFRRGAIVLLDKLDLESGPADCNIVIERETNTVRVSSANFYAFTLFLNDTLVDLDKPVEVFVNGNLAAKKKVERSMSIMLDDMQKNYLVPLRIVTAKLSVDVPAAGGATAESKPADGEKK